MDHAFPLSEAPGARASRICGIWALVTAVLCFPVALVLGILAVVQHGKARKLALASPETYRTPTQAGMVMGIVAMVLSGLITVLGMMSAIAIPALLSQRSRARDKAAIVVMTGRLGDLAMTYDKLSEQKLPETEVKAGLEAALRASAGQDNNPWDPASPATSQEVTVVTGLDEAGVAEAARTRATRLGQSVFVIQFPAKDRPGFLAGAVRTENAVNGGHTIHKTISL